MDFLDEDEDSTQGRLPRKILRIFSLFACDLLGIQWGDDCSGWQINDCG